MLEGEYSWCRGLQDEGIFIVCSGLVCVRYNVLGTPGQKYFLGTGGMFGPFSALTGVLSGQGRP